MQHGVMEAPVFGNALVESDSLPLRMLPLLRERLPDVKFIEADTMEDLEEHGPILTILDCAEGMEGVGIVTDIDSLHDSPRYSLHDFDLASSLKLLRKLGLVESVRIIAVPCGASLEDVLDETIIAIEGIKRLDGKA